MANDNSPCAVDATPLSAPVSAPAPQQQIEVEYWTDPLCCWSWALEPQWRRLRYEFDGALRWRYRMGGMIPEWSTYHDPLNSINRPSQMGPMWFQARHISGMPLEDRIWVEDPPASSFLPCLAIKAAERQSAHAAERYLRRAREALMMHRRNIARREVLLALADALAQELPDHFNAATFAHDLDAPATADALRADLMHAAYRNIGRFPTLTLRLPDSPRGILLVGYRPYPLLLEALRRLTATLPPSRRAESQEAYAHYWHGILPREWSEAAAP